MKGNFRFLYADERHRSSILWTGLKQRHQEAEGAECSVRHAGCEKPPRALRALHILPELECLLRANCPVAYRGHSGNNFGQVLLDPPRQLWLTVTKTGEDAGEVAPVPLQEFAGIRRLQIDRKSTRLNSSHVRISYAVFSFKNKNTHSRV